MIRITIFLIFAISFWGCLPSLKISRSEYKLFKLTNELAKSSEGDFSVFVPERWFQTKDVNYSGNELWLVNEKYNGVIVIKPINSKTIENSLDRNKILLSLARAGVILHRRKNESNFKLLSPPQLYRNDYYQYSSFEYEFGENQFARIIIIEVNGNYFESLAFTANKDIDKIFLFELYSTQESVLQSLKKR